MAWAKLQLITSMTEPELGLGIIEKIDQQHALIAVKFIKSNDVRNYALPTAPLERFALGIGDIFLNKKGEKATVTKISHKEQLYYYTDTEGNECVEHEISVLQRFSQNRDSIFKSTICKKEAYDLRKQAWQIKSFCESLNVKGMIGARVTPLPHQLYIAHTVSRRVKPRILLADEVGMGKTIEAGLIYSSMKFLGRGNRVLIVTPNPLIHQWMTEIYRRFGDMFSIFDENRCVEEEHSQGVNPFHFNQKILISMDFLEEHENRLQQVLESHWDLIIIDEAHHMLWDFENPNYKWQIGKKLAGLNSALLLLTATPRQHGIETLFGLLNLVSPKKYHDFDEYYEETFLLKKQAQLAQKFLQEKWDQSIQKEFKLLFANDHELMELADKPKIDFKKIVSSLLDRHGTGRVLFRNRRERIKGFPRRTLRSIPLSGPNALPTKFKVDSETISDVQAIQYATGAYLKHSYNDSFVFKAHWLATHLNQERKDKTLILCSRKETVLAILNFLEEKKQDWKQFPQLKALKISIFHENMSIVDRDKHAAYFADPQGAQVLICSEIGGEGRNFQFSKKMIFMDLPKLPDLLEQRIGRLDRIGQGKEIEIVVPWLEDSPEEVLFKWYHLGLNIFQNSWSGADGIMEELAEELIHTFKCFIAGHRQHNERYFYLEKVIEETKVLAAAMLKEKEESTDILLDLNSYDEKSGVDLREEIYDVDDNTDFEFFVKSVFDFYGVDYEELDRCGTTVVRSDAMMYIENFPGLHKDKDTVLAFDRDVALKREDSLFVTPDHPFMESCLSLFLDHNEGRLNVCKWPASPLGNGLVLDASIILGIQAPKELEIGRYLPLKHLSFALSHNNNIVDVSLIEENLDLFQNIDEEDLPFPKEKIADSVAPFIEKIMLRASQEAQKISKKAKRKAEEEFKKEKERLAYLCKVNPLISKGELVLLEKKYNLILSKLEYPDLTLDSIRLIFTQ